MDRLNGISSVDGVAEVLGSVRKKGVRLWTENGRVHYKAPRGALNDEEISRLRNSRAQLVALLEGHNGSDTDTGRITPRSHRECAPLAFSQLAHWHFNRLHERPAIRQIASATRLLGPLNLDALRRTIAEIVQRHDALRTRIVVTAGIPAQVIEEDVQHELVIDDLSGLETHSCAEEIRRAIDIMILEPINVAEGPLFGARLLRAGHSEHVLILVMEHIVSDAFSMNILLRELIDGYTQASQGREFSLPAIPVQFADYAVWQRELHGSRHCKRATYWDERLAGCERLKFPRDRSVSTRALKGWGTTPLRIGRELKNEMRSWCRLKRTTLVMSVFTAYVALVLRWCHGSEGIFLFQSDGRNNPLIEHTIGFFATVLYLRIELHAGDTFVGLMERIREEYCNAYSHADFSDMLARVPRPEFTRNTAFNWVPLGAKTDASEPRDLQDVIAWVPVPFEHPMLKNAPAPESADCDNEPSLLLYDCDEEIAGHLSFPRSRFSTAEIERFGCNFVEFIRALLRDPEADVSRVALLGGESK